MVLGTPTTFNPEMLKGTTFALQLATAVCYTSPVMLYADKPALYLKSPAVDVFKAIPSVWDETRVLAGSAIGLAVTTVDGRLVCMVGKPTSD